MQRRIVSASAFLSIVALAGFVLLPWPASGVSQSEASGAFHGITFAKGCFSPTVVGAPYSCQFQIGNNFDADTLTVTSIVDVIHANPSDVGSGNILPALSVTLSGGASCNAGQTLCTLPPGATIATSSPHAVYVTDANDPNPLTSSATLIWQDLCNTGAPSCPVGNQSATAGSQSSLVTATPTPTSSGTPQTNTPTLTNTPTPPANALHGVSIVKGCNAPTVVGAAYTCHFGILNNIDQALDTLTITSIVDVIHANPSDVNSGNILPELQFTFSGGASCNVGQTTCTLPAGSSIFTSSPYATYITDADDPTPLTSIATLTWQDSCSSGAQNCPVGNQSATTGSQSTLVTATPTPTMTATSTATNTPTATQTPNVEVTVIAADGATVTTGAAPTAGDVTTTEIDIPANAASNDFVLSITESQADGAPGGFAAFGQEIDIDAPGVTFNDPVTIVFTFDASITGGIPPALVQIFRDGVLVVDCTGPPEPDPCVSARVLTPSNDIEISVQTTAFSTWGGGVANADGDACTDFEESGPVAQQGGLRDPNNPYDFYDVNGSGMVDAMDIAQVRMHFNGAGPVPPQDVVYDRSVGVAPWAPGAPNGRINAIDIALVRVSFNHTCQPAP